MQTAWKDWEGRVVNREFRLGDYLGGSERAGVFATQYGPGAAKAAVKLIPVSDWDQATVEAELARLQSASELSHPYLLQILQAGRAKLDDTEILFVVMEYAEEDLSQILPNRPLSAEEMREILKPTLDALGHLHGKGLVHGHLKPGNVMAIGDQLKLSSDGISASGKRGGTPGQSSDYDAPEFAHGENSPASDVWSLGMLLVMALTQRLPDWSASGEERVVPENVPPPFDDIARHCLRRDARVRWSLADIAARASFGSPAEPAVPKRELRPGAARPRVAGVPASLVPQRKVNPAPPNFPFKRRSNAGAYVAVAVVLALVGIFVVPRLFRGGAIHSQAIEPQMGSQTGSAAQERPRRPAQAPARANPGNPQTRDRAARQQSAAETRSPVTGEKPEALSDVRGNALRRGLTGGQVAQQVLPDVPTSASETIHGTVRVGVRVNVDAEGNVTEADLDSAGPSKYFARLALEAAQQWKFEPPKMDGRSVLSDWLLRFQFTEKGAKVTSTQSDP